MPVVHIQRGSGAGGGGGAGCATCGAGCGAGGGGGGGAIWISTRRFCSSATPSPVCYYQSSLNGNLVEETNTYQAYGEVNYEFSDKLKLHVEGLYYRHDVPNIQLDSFTNIPQTFPITPGSPRHWRSTTRRAGTEPGKRGFQ